MIHEINMESLNRFCEDNQLPFRQVVHLAHAHYRVETSATLKWKAHRTGDLEDRQAYEKSKVGITEKTFEDSETFRSLFLSGDLETELIGDDFVRFARRTMQKTNHIRDHIDRMLDCDHQAFFVTLTWKDDILGSTTPETRRRYVTRCLSHFLDYDANIDFGSQNGREHYHAVVVADELPDLAEWESRYGFVKVERIGDDDSAPIAMARYVNKLTNHAMKVKSRRLTKHMSQTQKNAVYGVETPEADELPF